MKTLSKLIGSVIGGIGTIVGFSSLFTGCGDNDDNGMIAYYGPRPPSVTCCDNELGLTGDDYWYCMSQYEKINKCDREQLTMQPAVYGPAVSPKLAKACCGEDTSHADYDECYQDLMKDDNCNKPVPGSEKAIEKCCGINTQTATYKNCVSNYQKAGNVCSDTNPTQPIPTVYGPPPDEISPITPVPEES